MSYCVPHGIPHSRFLAWDPSDQEKALGWERERATTCPECGTRDEDWLDPTTRRPLDPPQWEPVPERCPGCAALDRMRRAVPDGPESAGVKVRIMPYDPDREIPDSMLTAGLSDDETGEL